jgi:hypothetical protein
MARGRGVEGRAEAKPERRQLVANSRIYAIKAMLSERFASAWILLSDTTNFLSRTNAFSHYELQLMELRKRLKSGAKDLDAVKAVREELVELRKALRLQGYDLALGSLDLELRGFRNDASVAEGFSRLVLYIGAKKFYFLAGEDNHVELDRLLRRGLAREDDPGIRQRHYLWYRWTHGLLTLSGSDTESLEDFEALKDWTADKDRKLRLLGALKGLR